MKVFSSVNSIYFSYNGYDYFSDLGSNQVASSIFGTEKIFYTNSKEPIADTTGCPEKNGRVHLFLHTG